MGHFDQFPPTNPSVGYQFGQETFAWATRNGQDAPIAVISELAMAARIAGQRPRLPDDRALIMRPELRAVRRCG